MPRAGGVHGPAIDPRSQASQRPRGAARRRGAEFASKGYEAATVAGIAARAGVTTGAVYGHFRSKLELLLEAVGLSTVEAFTRRGFAIAGRPASEVAPALARGLVGTPGGRRDLLLIDAIALARRDPNVAESYRRVIRAHVDAFERTAQLGVESGRIDPVLPIDELARLVLSLAFGVMALRALEQTPPSDATVARLTEQLLQPAQRAFASRGARARPRAVARARGRARAGRSPRADRAGRRRRSQPAPDRRGRGSLSRAHPPHPRRAHAAAE